MLTKKSKYGIKAALYLAAHAGRAPIAVGEVAQKENIPRKFLEAILLDLKRQGVLGSKRGKAGGYYLRHKPDEITVGQIIRTLDGPLALIPCVSQTAYARCEECSDEATCSVRIAMKRVRDATARILDGMTLKNLTAAASGQRRGLVRAKPKTR